MSGDQKGEPEDERVERPGDLLAYRNELGSAGEHDVGGLC